MIILPNSSQSAPSYLKTILKKKYKAASLLYAIFISFLIFSIIGVFILANYYSRLHLDSYNQKVIAIHDLNSAINYLKADTRIGKWEEKLSISNENNLVSLKSEPWGLYKRVTAFSHFKTDTFRKSALMGYKYNNYNVALYLANHNQSLSISGDARITGDAFLSQRGIERAYIEGKSYSGSKTIEGSLKESNRSLPSLRKDLVDELKSILNYGIPKLADTLIDMNNLLNEGVLNYKRSFYESTVGMYSTEKIDLIEGEVEGPVIIKSEQTIRIGSAVKLENILVVAPKVYIDDNFRGTVQVIAQDSIQVGKNCTFLYPSTLVVESSSNQPYIEISEGSEIFGEILLHKERVESRGEGLISIAQEAKVVGQVFSTAKVELKGEIIGKAIADKLFLKTTSSIYENYLLDGIINAKQLPTYFVGSGVIPSWSKDLNNVMLWLK